VRIGYEKKKAMEERRWEKTVVESLSAIDRQTPHTGRGESQASMQHSRRGGVRKAGGGKVDLIYL